MLKKIHSQETLEALTLVTSAGQMYENMMERHCFINTLVTDLTDFPSMNATFLLRENEVYV